MSLILEDNSGNFWLLGVNAQGQLTALGTNVPGSFLFLNTLTGSSFQISIAVRGAGIDFVSTPVPTEAYPQTVTIVTYSTGSWVLQLNSIGQIEWSFISSVVGQTIPAPAAQTKTAYLIPLTNQPQSLSITLAGVQYNLKVWWNNIGQTWIVDIFDANNNPLATGLPMVTGADLVEQFEYLGLGGQLVAQSSTNDPNAVPTFADLGVTSGLYFVVENGVEP